MPQNPIDQAFETGKKTLSSAAPEQRILILEEAWRSYRRDPERVETEAILLAHLSTRLSLMALDLRESSPQARQTAPRDLIRAGLLGMQVALDSLRDLDWQEVEPKAEELARQAMLIRSQRPRL